jgi:hypothetical protein
MRRIIRRTVCTAESTTESRSVISHTFHNDMEKQHPHKSKRRRRRHEPTPASFFSGVQYIISVRESEGNMLGSAHASTTYGM